MAKMTILAAAAVLMLMDCVSCQTLLPEDEESETEERSHSEKLCPGSEYWWIIRQMFTVFTKIIWWCRSTRYTENHLRGHSSVSEKEISHWDAVQVERVTEEPQECLLK
ncbi:unnamed protein product [Acanthoscelides obtectus]|uniref:Uncharacterized protein n=1 Tax=Acanthoscelides obtectus TaxID=200917 RepID=A0A9P0PR45_ACAOB|nr:unnamed protein product [Acanthoscelides obtectus]CAK1656854.1 hypothetical protein AOBTE_LOCUS19966 [Acanthoscelides obtectus]